MELRNPRGMKDLMPEEMALRDRMISVLKRTFEERCFLPLETPAMELLDVLRAKCGEDVGKQIFEVGGKLGMRFDLTVPLARVVASRKELPKPFRRYCIGRVWRREEPQKGRRREFWQADVDIVGSKSMKADAEVVATAAEGLKRLGFNRFTILINNRKIADAMLRKIGVGRGLEFAVFRAIDKLEKIGEEGVVRELEKEGLSDVQIDELLSFVSMDGSNDEKLEQMEGAVLGVSAEGVKELREFLGYLRMYEIGRSCEVKVDPSLMRGLDYYTGPIFEIKVPEGDIGSVAGGGRYDELIALYGGEPTPATGISLGIERLVEIMKERPVKVIRKVFVAPVKEKNYGFAMKMVEFLRSSGIPTEIDIMGRTLRKQMEYANALNFDYALIIGGREEKEGKVTLRDLKSGDEALVDKESLIKKLKDQSHNPNVFKKSKKNRVG